MARNVGQTAFVRNVQRVLAKECGSAHASLHRQAKTGVLMHWQIQLPLSGSDGWFLLCTVESPEMVAEVVRILLRADVKTIARIQIVAISL